MLCVGLLTRGMAFPGRLGPPFPSCSAARFSVFIRASCAMHARNMLFLPSRVCRLSLVHGDTTEDEGLEQENASAWP